MPRVDVEAGQCRKDAQWRVSVVPIDAKRNSSNWVPRAVSEAPRAIQFPVEKDVVTTCRAGGRMCVKRDPLRPDLDLRSRLLRLHNGVAHTPDSLGHYLRTIDQHRRSAVC